MRSIVLLVLAGVGVGCVAPHRYAALEALYDGVVEDRDRVASERDAVQSEVAAHADRAEAHAARVSAARAVLVAAADGRGVVQDRSAGPALVLSADGLFQPRTAELSEEGRQVVAGLANALAAHADGRFRIAGHTDATPLDSREFPSNWHLGADRAIRIATALVVDGLPAERVFVASFGEHNPAASNAEDAGMAANRRVVITALLSEPPR